MNQKRLRSIENEAKIEKAPTTTTTAHMFKVEFNFRSPQKMSYIAKFERFEKAFRLYIFEKSLIKKVERFTIFMHDLQIDIIKSMVIASLYTALIALTILLVISRGMY